MDEQDESRCEKPAESRRRFTLADAMVLVATTAVGLQGAREAVKKWSGWPPRGVGDGFELSIPILASIAAGGIGAAALSSRRQLWQVLRRPGAIACLMVWVDAAVGWSIGEIQNRNWDPYYCRPDYTIYDHLIIGNGGKLVFYAWLALVLAGVWVPAPDWPDRAGRILGFVMMSWWVVETVRWLF